MSGEQLAPAHSKTHDFKATPQARPECDFMQLMRSVGVQLEAGIGGRPGQRTRHGWPTAAGGDTVRALIGAESRRSARGRLDRERLGRPSDDSAKSVGRRIPRRESWSPGDSPHETVQRMQHSEKRSIRRAAGGDRPWHRRLDAPARALLARPFPRPSDGRFRMVTNGRHLRTAHGRDRVHA